ncbi:isoprenoid synthase domain-containing protein [Crucibulum laeve]|uniref:Isoprenoid synthase domain-containing protein n=1 Tax=Crucibulum laeve TaxID=68775 RepID=A0A5C3LTU2_9AGAR|nr:isoprenoid synthase domain-containing protein [Crucibulum laeve]
MATACEPPASPTPDNPILGSSDFFQQLVTGNFLDIPFKTCFCIRQYDNSDIAEVISDVQRYFVDNWPWKSTEECQSFLDADLEWATLLAYPDVLPECARQLSLYIVWAFLIDDTVDNWSQQDLKIFLKGCNRMLKEYDCQVEEVEEEPESQSIYLTIMRDVFNRMTVTEISDPGAPTPARDLCRGTCQWLLNTTNIAGRKGAMQSPSLETYLEFRVQDTGMRLSKEMIAWGCGRPIKQHLWEDSNLKLLDDLTSQHVALANDLCSYWRETEVAKQTDAGEVSKAIANAVAFVIQKRALDEKDAIQFLWNYLSNLETEILKVEEIIKATYPSEELNEAGVDVTLVHPEGWGEAGPQPLPTISIDPPTISIFIQANNTPMACRKARSSLPSSSASASTKKPRRMSLSRSSLVHGRSAFHLGVLLETLRYKSFELSPGSKLEPIEEVTVLVKEEYTGGVVQKLTIRKGEMISYDVDDTGEGWVKVFMDVPARGLIRYMANLSTTSSRAMNCTRKPLIQDGMGHPSRWLSASRQSTQWLLSKPEEHSSSTRKHKFCLPFPFRFSPLLAYRFALPPLLTAYLGMVVGESSKSQDIYIDPCVKKQLMNVCAAGVDEKLMLASPKVMTLEETLAYMGDDELIEITTSSVCLRKAELDANRRIRSKGKK